MPRPYQKRNSAYWSAMSQPRLPESAAPQQMAVARLPDLPKEIAEGTFEENNTFVRVGHDYRSVLLGGGDCQFPFISALGIPFEESGGFTSVTEAINLCQRIYFSFAPFRNTIELFVDLCIADIYVKCKNKTVKVFTEKWLEKIKHKVLQEHFYREYWRSGNVFIYRFDGTLRPQDLKKMESVFGAALAEDDQIPIAYTVLNPINIGVTSGVFATHTYFKLLSPFEIAKLKNAQPDSMEEQILQSLPEDVQRQIRNAQGISRVLMALDPKRLSFSFYCKQPYEYMGVPFGNSALTDIEQKLALKKTDKVIARAIEGIILLVTVGDAPDKGGINTNNIIVLNNLLKTPAAARSIVSDYTTKMSFIVPEVKDIIGEIKYKEVDKDIAEALMNPLLGENRFADLMAKLKVLGERMEKGPKESFKNFLTEEVKRMSDAMGFKNYPTLRMKKISFEDPAVRDKVTTRLAELGILTGPQTIKTIETGLLPETETNIEDQKLYKKDRDDGLFLPLIGGSTSAQMAEGGAAGRPPGTGVKKSSNKVGVKTAAEVITPQDLKRVTDETVRLGNFAMTLLEDSATFSDVDKPDFARYLVEETVKNHSASKWQEVVRTAVETQKPIEAGDFTRKAIAKAEELECDDYGAALFAHTLALREKK